MTPFKTVVIGSYWLSAIFNDDTTALDDGQEAMLEEWQSMIAGCTQVDESIFQTKRRQTTEWFSWTQGHWIRPASHLIRKFM